ncbi:MAG: methyl-accepting chemotaxis protein, partial [Patescibacteria group bacterium]
TKKAATNVKEIDALANESQKQAEDARTTLTSIKKLATAHEALLQTLQQYSEQVDRVASDVRKLARAIKYLSLNATIEASKDGRDSHSLSALVSEVGRLSVMSRDASIHINSLVRTIQDQLSQSKASALQEREEAQLSLRVLDKALSSLQEMSDDAITIAKSVTIIDDQIRKQTESTQSIASHSKDLTGQAKATLREAGKVTDLVGELKNSAHANSTAVNKLLGIIAKLGSMIGSRR